MTRISHASQSEVLCTRWYARVPTWPTQSKLSVGSSQIQRKSTGKQSNGYLRGSSKTCLCFGQSESLLQGYTDANMAGDVDSRKSTSGYLITYSGGAVSWQSRLQKCVALSTTEAEFIAATEACKKILWMKMFLHELGNEQEKYILYCESQSVIYLSMNSSFHSRSKHINAHYHKICNVLNEKLL